MVALGVIIQQLFTGTMMRTSISPRTPEPSLATAVTLTLPALRPVTVTVPSPWLMRVA